MKKVCVLLPWSFLRDSRAQRTARTMARHAEVHVYYVASTPGTAGTEVPGNSRIRLFPVHLRPSFMSWILRHTLFFLATARMVDAVLATGNRYQVIYAHDLPSTYPALRLARRHKAKLIYDVHDLYVETINQGFPQHARFLKRTLFSLEQRFMRTTAAAWERRFMRRADLIMTVTAGCLGYLEERYGLVGGIVLHNYPELREVPRSGRLFQACSIPTGKSIVLYHGNFGRARHLDLIVRSAGHLAEGIVLVLVGSGAMEAELRALALQPDLAGKVIFLDYVPYDELLSLATAASLGLALIEVVNLSTKFALGNKVTEYMASGVPVLASDSIENRRIILEADSGYLWSVTTPEALGALVNTLLADKADLARKGQNGRKAFRERFHWEAGAQFEQAFLKLIETA